MDWKNFKGKKVNVTYYEIPAAPQSANNVKTISGVVFVDMLAVMGAFVYLVFDSVIIKLEHIIRIDLVA